MEVWASQRANDLPHKLHTTRAGATPLRLPCLSKYSHTSDMVPRTLRTLSGLRLRTWPRDDAGVATYFRSNPPR